MTGFQHCARARVPAALLLLWLLPASASVAEKIIAEGDLWRFRNGFSPPPAGWNTNGFDDSGWFNFPSGFGYGDADDRTVLADMQNGYAAFFTRKTFVVHNPATLNRMTLAVDYDDGFVAWINGVEVARRNVTSNTINHATLAAGNHEASRGAGPDNPQPKEFITITNDLATLLVPGTNTIAVSCHNVSLGSSDASLIVEVYTNVTLVRGPFIQMPRPDTLTVVWHTDALTDSAVDYGLTTAYEAGTVSDPAPVREHAIAIAGLLPSTNYFYRVRSGGVTLAEAGRFRTPAAAHQPFRFVVIGDHGQGTPGMSNIAARINERTDFDFKITVGDNIYGQAGAAGANFDGAPGYYDPFWFALYAPTMARVPTFVCLGNHDVDTANGQWSVEYFHMPTNGPPGQLEKNYSFQYGNAHFAVIDTEPFEDNQTAIMDAIKTWLSNDLAAATQPWKFVFLHRPPWTSVGGHDDNPRVKTQLTPLFAQHGVQIVFQGHNHWYERINAINGVHYITTGAAGAGLYGVVNRKEYSAVLRNDLHSYTLVDITGSRLNLRQIDATGTTIDEFNLDIAHPFRMDGLLDDPAWLRADNGLRLYAAIRGVYLYVATQDAGEGGDNFIFLNNTLSTNRPAPWAKSGTVMQWNMFLADENDNAFHRWFGSTELQHSQFPYFQSMTSGLNNNGSFNNGVLEGSLDLTNRFGSFPQQLYLAAAAFGSPDGGSLTAVVPAGNSGGNVTNWLAINTRDIALDLPVAHAGSNQTAEAGMPVILNGSASTAPSGLPLSFHWTQTAGPPVTLLNSNSAVAGFTLMTNLNTVLGFQLSVHDTRFSSNATTTVTVTEILDSDGDGLSDLEETTGTDNALTAPDPGGRVTNPNNPDTDGDGQSDGAEALAATDPNNPAEAFRILSIQRLAGGEGVVITWSSVAGKSYIVRFAASAAGPYTDLSGPITATGPTTTFTNTTAATAAFYRVRLAP